MEGEKKKPRRRNGAGCTRRKLGLMILHAAAPKHPHSSCWSVCVCVYFLCIDLVSYFHVRKEEPVLFNCNADVLILMNICTNI